MTLTTTQKVPDTPDTRPIFSTKTLIYISNSMSQNIKICDIDLTLLTLTRIY
jgi:hypothetical protein